MCDVQVSSGHVEPWGGDLLGKCQRAKAVDYFCIFQGNILQVVAGKECILTPEAALHNGADGTVDVNHHGIGHFPDLMQIVDSRKVQTSSLTSLKNDGTKP